MTLDEMREMLEAVSAECRSTLPVLGGSDAEHVGGELARLADEANRRVVGLIEWRRPA